VKDKKGHDGMKDAAMKALNRLDGIMDGKELQGLSIQLMFAPEAGSKKKDKKAEKPGDEKSDKKPKHNSSQEEKEEKEDAKYLSK
tara:strand:+ start:110 stop:364 length:255 start_codon:yes stop_codon:yes gene_type:complete